MTQTRKTMQRAGFRSYKLRCQDDNGGLPLVTRWHVLQQDIPPRGGELTGGHMTRAEAWRAAEDAYERVGDPISPGMPLKPWTES